MSTFMRSWAHMGVTLFIVEGGSHNPLCSYLLETR